MLSTITNNQFDTPRHDPIPHQETTLPRTPEQQTPQDRTHAPGARNYPYQQGALRERGADEAAAPQGVLRGHGAAGEGGQDGHPLHGSQQTGGGHCRGQLHPVGEQRSVHPLLHLSLHRHLQVLLRRATAALLLQQGRTPARRKPQQGGTSALRGHPPPLIGYSYPFIITVMAHLRRERNSDFQYSPAEEDCIPEFNPQSKYAKLYEKYTSEASDSFTFDYQPRKRTGVVEGEDSWRVRELSAENAALREELGERKQQIERLKYQLYYCNSQLEQITKIENYEYQQAVIDLRQEIETMLERNRLAEEELLRLKLVQEGEPKRERQRQEQKENNCLLINLEVKKQQQSRRQLMSGLRDMYSKITGCTPKSLKELWKWLKDLGQMANRMRKWGRKYREYAKSSLFLTLQGVMPFLEEAILIIN